MINFNAYSFWEDDYIPIENDFFSYLKYVPLSKDHKDVWSLKLANQLLIIGNSIESFFKCILRYYLDERIKEHNLNCPAVCGYHGIGLEHTNKLNEKLIRDNTNIGTFRECFEEFYELSKRTVYVLRNKGDINPFQEWGNNDPTQWWKVYRNLKHDKYGNKESATLEIVLKALAALFLINVHHYESRSFLVITGATKANMGLNNTNSNLIGLMEDLQEKPIRTPWIPITKTKLFAYIYDDAHYWNKGIDDPWRIIDPGHIYG